MQVQDQVRRSANRHGAAAGLRQRRMGTDEGDSPVWAHSHHAPGGARVRVEGRRNPVQDVETLNRLHGDSSQERGRGKAADEVRRARHRRRHRHVHHNVPGGRSVWNGHLHARSSA